MTDSRFFASQGPLTLADIAEHIGAICAKESQAIEVSDVAPLCDAGPGHLAFFNNKKYLSDFENTKATACIVHPDYQDKAPEGLHLLVTPMPYYAYAKAAGLLYPEPCARGIISPHAYIDESAKIGDNVDIGHGTVIEAGAEIGDNTIIKSNVTIGANTIIGKKCKIDANVAISHAVLGDAVSVFSGAVIGQPGFGFAFSPMGYESIPQLGRVMIGDKAVIGANSAIDRGANTDTVIGEGTMLDNLVQIGHNVKIGKMCVVAGQSAIAGSAVIEDYVMMGGQCGVSGHITIGTGAKFSGRSAILRSVPAGQEYIGNPAMPKKQYTRQLMALARLIRKKK